MFASERCTYICCEFESLAFSSFWRTQIYTQVFECRGYAFQPQNYNHANVVASFRHGGKIEGFFGIILSAHMPY